MKVFNMQFSCPSFGAANSQIYLVQDLLQADTSESSARGLSPFVLLNFTSLTDDSRASWVQLHRIC